MLRTPDRLANLIAVFCILSWRIFWITMVHRAGPHLPVEVALTPHEIQRLAQLVKDTAKTSTADVEERNNCEYERIICERRILFTLSLGTASRHVWSARSQVASLQHASGFERKFREYVAI
jgi:hypothetical protein